MIYLIYVWIAGFIVAIVCALYFYYELHIRDLTIKELTIQSRIKDSAMQALVAKHDWMYHNTKDDKPALTCKDLQCEFSVDSLRKFSDAKL